MVLFNLMEELEKIGSEFQGFIIENKDNPLLWIGLFVSGIVIFKAVFYALDKNK